MCKFDEQIRRLEFRSWTYGIDQLDLHVANRKSEVGLSRFVPNGEWSLASAKVIRSVIGSGSAGRVQQTSIAFVLRIQRRVAYYVLNLIIPCVAITAVAICGFLLPPDSREKISLCMTVLLSLTVFLNMVAETMPVTSDTVPLLGT